MAALIGSCLSLALPAHANGPHAEVIWGPFASGTEVTQTCLMCHDQQGEDFLHSAHWTWSSSQTVNGKTVQRGKKDVINNYCISAGAGNQASCSRCHAGYGWTDNQFDFADSDHIDCLVCHDTTGTYVKAGDNGGQPLAKVNLERVAQQVGMPNRDNCGACHFFGGGGDGVKHGDLDSSMSYPDKATDVHMDVDGNDMNCQQCHRTEQHQIGGHSLGVSPMGSNHISCTDCHDSAPHQKKQLNQHLASVACQTCHIPQVAKNEPTKMSWDWSTAGQDRTDVSKQFGKKTFLKKKGDFEWGKNITPEYAWYNGQAGAYQIGDKIDASTVTKLTYPLGDISDKHAKIYPFKVHRGKQIYDSKQNILLTPKTTGDDGYWHTFDWASAARLGMEQNASMQALQLSFSGSYGFAETEMWWRLNHMVSPKEHALGCMDCHGNKGRMPWQQLGYPADPMRNKAAQALRD
ncbi:tetrathionate reductase family octaheme c-type cytochrome [uncultured Ferrimonas sp.]|uniref:tetrathionate reductase family octaheme c-type cytochrome n=1 Tax=uncultured Ferrimonas sp. TaxID=432640 RepID=UPI002626E03E|nr:tetrathionate reductase family octaheme c-type cytochrome [uncultured Ferrimonas sp.]